MDFYYVQRKHQRMLYRNESTLVGRETDPILQQLGTAEQWIKKEKSIMKWTLLSGHDFVDS